MLEISNEAFETSGLLKRALIVVYTESRLIFDFVIVYLFVCFSLTWKLIKYIIAPLVVIKFAVSSMASLIYFFVTCLLSVF